MAISDISAIMALITRLDASKPARCSYNQTAFDTNEIEGSDTFSLAQDNNIPLPDGTAINDTILDRGFRSQAASFTRSFINHFMGRLSYNLAKLTQQVLAFFVAEEKIWANNAFLYDAGQKYRQNAVCYIIGTVGAISTVQFYIRTSSSPLDLTGVSPTDIGQTDWVAVQYRTGAFSLLPLSAPGYRHQYSIADLTSGTYDTTKWYPVTTDPFTAEIPTSTEDPNTLQVEIEAYTVGAVSGLTGNYRAELAVLSKFNGYDASSGSIIKNNSIIKVSDGTSPGDAANPIGYSVLPKGQQGVVWLKGGSIYALWNSFGATFTVHTASYSNPAGDTAVVPGTARVFTVTYGKMWGQFKVNAAVDSDDAVQKSQNDTALALKAPLASPVLTGNPAAPTQSALDNSTKIASTAYADAAVAVEKARALAAEAAISAAASPIGTVVRIGPNDASPASLYPGTTWTDVSYEEQGTVLRVGTSAIGKSLISGTPATFTVSVSGGAPTISLVSGGSPGYYPISTTIPLTLVGACSTQWVGTATVNSSGVITGVNVTTAGAGYGLGGTTSGSPGANFVQIGATSIIVYDGYSRVADSLMSHLHPIPGGGAPGSASAAYRAQDNGAGPFVSSPPVSDGAVGTPRTSVETTSPYSPAKKYRRTA